MFAELEAAHAAEVEALYAEATAFMSDADVADQIAEIEDRRKETSYHLKYSTQSVHEDTELLMALRGEQGRRQRVADEDRMDPVEEWRDIAGFEGVYKVSSWGRVYSVLRIEPMKNGRLREYGGRILEPTSTQEYPAVTLYKGGSKTQRKIHLLVLQAFVGAAPDGMEACHNDGNAWNARLSNLRYDTHAANVLDRFRHGTVLRGEQIKSSKLSEQEVRQIKAMLAEGFKARDLSVIFNISPENIWKIERGDGWQHVDAVNQYREAATLNTVADFLCAAVASSTSLDSVREGSVQLQAAE